MATFIINGQTVTLEMRDRNGVDWSNDFIGGYDHRMLRDENGNFVVTQEEYDWWEQVFADQDAMRTLITEYKERYGDEEVERRLHDTAALDVDLDMMLKRVRTALASLD